MNLFDYVVEFGVFALLFFLTAAFLKNWKRRDFFMVIAALVCAAILWNRDPANMLALMGLAGSMLGFLARLFWEDMAQQGQSLEKQAEIPAEKYKPGNIVDVTIDD